MLNKEEGTVYEG